MNRSEWARRFQGLGYLIMIAAYGAIEISGLLAVSMVWVGGAVYHIATMHRELDAHSAELERERRETDQQRIALCEMNVIAAQQARRAEVAELHAKMFRAAYEAVLREKRAYLRSFTN